MTTPQRKMRMYILVKDSVPDDYVPLMVGHAVTTRVLDIEYSKVDYMENRFHLRQWYNKNNQAMVVCSVSEDEFQQAIREADNYIIQSETNGLDPEHLTDCVVAFSPRYEYPKCFKDYKLWRVKEKNV